jgi:hypothetical protein
LPFIKVFSIIIAYFIYSILKFDIHLGIFEILSENFVKVVEKSFKNGEKRSQSVTSFFFYLPPPSPNQVIPFKDPFTTKNTPSEYINPGGVSISFLGKRTILIYSLHWGVGGGQNFPTR